MEEILFLFIGLLFTWSAFLSILAYESKREIRRLHARCDCAADIFANVDLDIEDLDLRLRDQEDFESKQVVHNVNYEQDLMAICEEIEFLEDDGQNCMDKISADTAYLFSASNRHESILDEARREIDLTMVYVSTMDGAIHKLDERLKKLEKQPAPRKR